MDGLNISGVGRRLADQSVSSLSNNRITSSPLGKKSGTSETSFASTLKNAINSVDSMQKNADVMMQKIATGESKNISEVMVATEKADIALKLMVQVRNKIIDAYQEIMKMQA